MSADQFETHEIGDSRFTVLKRYTHLRSVGSGAQGIVWYANLIINHRSLLLFHKMHDKFGAPST